VSEFLVITGLSGAGRSQAADDLEDLGWFVVDNLPPSLIPKVAELASAPGSTVDRIALVVGTGRYHAEALAALSELRTMVGRVRVLFLDASTDVLVRRYASTRRRHPLTEVGGAGPDAAGGAGAAGAGVAEAIERERRVLEGIKAEADVVVDTSELNIHQLRARMVALFGPSDPAAGMQTTLLSFGFKHGLPLDVDIVLDLRFLPNPYWVEGLRDMTGLDAPVRDYVLAAEGATEFLDRATGLLELLLPAYVKEGKSYLTIALGCTGGHHRSVVIAEELARRLRSDGAHPLVRHRDIAR
jgi:UPF0042 nucleotide-binding protein